MPRIPRPVSSARSEIQPASMAAAAVPAARYASRRSGAFAASAAYIDLWRSPGGSTISLERKSKGYATQAWPTVPNAFDPIAARVTSTFTPVRDPESEKSDVVRVTVLGSGDAFGSGGRLHSGYLVEAPGTAFLVDCGPSVLQAMKRIGKDPAVVDFVLLSHLHGDHFGGVPFLFMEYRYESQRTRPFAVFGPPHTERRVRTLFTALYEKPADEAEQPFPLRFEELVPDRERAIGDVRVLPFIVRHVTELVAFGYRIDVAGRSILYSGDAAWSDDFVARSRGVDLFICECSTYETRLPIHIAYPEIAARRADLGCRRLVLSHLGREPLRHLGEITLECAEDGMTLDL
jgi:ribonuclease BN (tRNA processing enzyme)